MNKFIIIISIILVSSCSKDKSTTFTPPVKVKYSSIDVGNIERYIITDLFAPSYTKLADNNNLSPFFKLLTEDIYDDYKFESFDLKANSKVTIEVSNGSDPNAFAEYNYSIKDDKINIFDSDPTKYFELLIASPEIIQLPIYMSVYFENGIGKIPYSYDGLSIKGATPSIDDLIKHSIPIHNLNVNDTIYAFRVNYLYKAE